MDSTIDKNNSSYLISILYLLLIITIMLSRFLSTSQSLNKIPNLEIDGTYQKKEIYDVLQLNYDIYKNEALFKTQINENNYLEIYVATKSTNQTNSVDYLYFYNCDEQIKVNFSLYRNNSLIDTFNISELNPKVGIINFEGIEFEQTDIIKITIYQNNKQSSGDFKTKYYYNKGIIY